MFIAAAASLRRPQSNTSLGDDPPSSRDGMSARRLRSDASRNTNARGAGAGRRSNSKTRLGQGFADLQQWMDVEIVRRMKKLETQLDSMALRVINMNEELALVANTTLSFQGKMKENGHRFQPTPRGGSPPPKALAFDPTLGPLNPELGPLDPAVGGLPIAPSKWSVNFTARSEASLPLPVGDKLALTQRGDAPNMEPWTGGHENHAVHDHFAAGDVAGHRISEDVDIMVLRPGSPPRAGGLQRNGVGMDDDMPSRDKSRMPANSDRPPTIPPGNGSRKSNITAESMQMKATMQPKWMRAVWNFLDDPESGPAAAWYNCLIPYFIMVSTIFAIFMTMDEPWMNQKFILNMEIVFDVFYLLEFLIRYICCPSKLLFWFRPTNIIDLGAGLPIFLRAAIGFDVWPASRTTFECTLLLAWVPFVRSMKSLRRFEQLRLIVEAFNVAGEGLPICLFTLFVLTIGFASLIYLLEPRSNITSMPHSMWLTVVTMTTVGYGDTIPKSTSGHFVVASLVIVSVLYMAIPLGIVGNAFSQVWQERDFILLRSKVKAKFNQWGYGADDFPTLFEIFDDDQDGELTLPEFMRMMDGLHIGLAPDRSMQLFESLDQDGGGTLQVEEFVKALFPTAYRAQSTGVELVERTSRAEQMVAQLSRMSSRSGALVC